MKGERATISVIVPVFQAAATLRNCLEALLEQKLSGSVVEVLLIDNNSTDSSAAVAAEFPEVQWLHESRQGAYAARNHGLAAAQGAIIAFTDPDCVPVANWLEELTAPLASPEVQVVQGRTRFGGSGVLVGMIEEYERARDEEVFAGDDPLLYYGRTNNLVARAELFDELGCFEERERGADTLLVRRTVERYGCRSVVFCSRAQVLHREIIGICGYYRKAFTYGRSSESYGKVIPAGTPGRALRRKILRRTAREASYSPFQAAALLLLLGLGRAAWLLGTWRAKLGREGR